MSSSINPNDIDGAYPVAGQDNDSQGFRDNFTNIKTNFQYAEDEINDLQTNVILKAALTGEVLDNNMNDALLYAAKIQDFSATRVAFGAQIAGATVTVDYEAGHYQTVTTSGAGGITLAFANWPAAGSVGLVRVQITIAAITDTVTLPAAVNVGTTGIQGYAGNVITFGATGTYEFEFVTNNGGTNITIFDLNRAYNYYTNPIYLTGSEDLANGAAASLLKTASYFTTGSSETATLAAGSPGQIKTFMMAADGGDMVITVATAGWKSSGTGTITFNDIGDACTLQYVNSKWYAIGANGVTFA
jgi:hypothetical protein